MEPGRKKYHEEEVPAPASDGPNANATLLGSTSGATHSSQGTDPPPEQYGMDDDIPRPSGVSAGRIKRPCRVPGCLTDVSGMKSFNWRYRICEGHRSASSAVIDGLRVRFCQMCAKFHELTEFQGQKMSCQKKLDDHNARRRVGFQNRDGSARRSDNTMSINRSSSSSMNLPTPSTVLLTSERQSRQNSVFEALAAVLVPPPTLPGSHMPNNNSAPADSSAAPWLPGIDDQAPVLPNPAVNDEFLSTILQVVQSANQGQGANIDVGATISRSDGQNQFMPLPTSVNFQNPQTQSLLETLSDLIAANPNPNMSAHTSAVQPLDSGPSTWMIPQSMAAADAALSEHQSYIPDVSSPGQPALHTVGYVPESRLVRISIKLFGCQPSDLDPSVREDFEALMRTDAHQLEAYVRPGCAHVTLDIRLPAGRGPPAATDAVDIAGALLQRRGAARALAPFLVQVGDQVAVGIGPNVSSSAPLSALVRKSAELGALIPKLLLMEPRAVVAGDRTTVVLRGRGLSKPSDLPMCRQNGINVTLDVLGSSESLIDDKTSGQVAGESLSTLLTNGLEWIEVRPLGLVPGCAEFEVERGTLLSEAVPLLVLPGTKEGRAAAAEVCLSLGASKCRLDNEYQFMRDVGIVLHCAFRKNELTGSARCLDGRVKPMADCVVQQLVQTCAVHGWHALGGLLAK